MPEVFPKSIDSIISSKLSDISKSDRKFMAGWDNIERSIYSRVLKHVKKFDQSVGGVIDYNPKNVDQVNELSEVIRAGIQDSEYPKKVKEYLRDFEMIKKYNIETHKSVNNLSGKDLEKLINPVQKQTIDDTISGLTGAGIDTQFIQPMKEGIMRNIVGGATISDLEDYIGSFILTNETRLGQLKKYSSQIARDTLNQYDGQINARIAAEYGLDAGRYVGSIIDDSRPQCVRWVSREILLLSELDKEIQWAYNNGTGMIPGTNPANFSTYRGGYNCRHSFIPFKMTKSQREEYDKMIGKEEGEEKEKEKKTNKKVEKQINEVDSSIKKTKAIVSKPPKEEKFERREFFSSQHPDDNEKVLKVVEATGATKLLNDKKIKIIFRDEAESTTRQDSEYFLEAINRPWTRVDEIGTMGEGVGGNFSPMYGFINIKANDFRKIDYKKAAMEKLDPGMAEDYVKKGFDRRFGVSKSGQEVIREGYGISLYKQYDGSWKPWTIRSGSTYNIAPTITHEVGHFIQHNGDSSTEKLKALMKKRSLTINDAPSQYGKTNIKEFWTESFTQYIYSYDEMKIREPKLFSFVEEYLDVIKYDKSKIKFPE